MAAGLSTGAALPAAGQEPPDLWPVALALINLDACGQPCLRQLNGCARTLLQAATASDSLTGLAIVSLLQPEQQAGFVEDWRRAQGAGSLFRWEGRLGEGDGPPTWIRLEATALEPGLWHGVFTDITALRLENGRLEQALINAGTLLDAVPIAIARLERTGEDPSIIAINHQFERSFGYASEQLRRLSDWQRLACPDPRDRAELAEQWDRAVQRASVAAGGVEWIGFQVRAADGRQRQVLFSAQVQGPELLVTLLDVTDRQQAEGELRQAREQLAQTALEVTEAIPVGTYTMVLRPGRPLAEFSFMSERFLTLTGLKREDALADPLKAFACVHPDDYDEWVRMNAEVFEKKLPFFGETRLIVDGVIRWITAESVPRDLPDGSTVWEGVLIDVTDRIEAQQQLKRSQVYLEGILSHLPVAIAINSLDLVNPEITFLNQTFIRTLGYTRADIPYVADFARLAYPDPEYRQTVFCLWNQALERAMACKGSVEQLEYRLQTRDGQQLQMLISAVVLDEMVLIAMVDVTRIREAEKQLLEALERETRREEALRREMEQKLRLSLSASAVAHEITQPLCSILLNSKLALRAIDDDQPDTGLLRTLLEPLVTESQRVHLISDRIRMLLRNVETNRVPLDLREVVMAAELELRAVLLSVGASLECRLPEQACATLGDAVQLQLALGNLLRNGLEALTEAASAQPRLLLSLKAVGAGFELTVADSGPGFPPGFDPQIPLNTTKIGGSGLGLYLVQLTLENHAGQMQCRRSQELGGAEVVLQLPQALPD